MNIASRTPFQALTNCAHRHGTRGKTTCGRRRNLSVVHRPSKWMGGCGKGIVPCWIEYLVQQHVSFVNTGKYGSTQSHDQHQKLLLNKCLGPPFSVAAWENKKGSLLFASRDGKMSCKFGFGKLWTVPGKRVSGKCITPEASRLVDGCKAVVQAVSGSSQCSDH